MARWSRRFVWLAVLFVLLAVGLYSTRESTLHPLLTRVTPWASRTFSPYELVLADIEGDWRHSLVLHGVELRPTSSGLLIERFEADELAISGDLVTLVRTQRLGPGIAIRAEAPRARIDATAARGSESGSESSGDGPLAALAGTEFEVNRGQLTLVTASDTLEFTDLEITGCSTPGAPLTVRGEVAAAEWKAAVDVRAFAGHDGAVQIEGGVPSGEARGVELSAADLVVTASSGRLHVESGSLVVGANRISADSIVVAFDERDGTTLGGELTLALGDVASARDAVAAITGSEPRLRWGGSAFGSVRLQPAPAKVATGRVVLTGSDIEVEGIRLGRVEVELEADDRRVRVTQLSAVDGDSELRGTGAYVHADRSLENVSLRLQIEQPARYVPELALIVGLSGNLLIEGPLDALRGSIDLVADEVRAGSVRLEQVVLEGSLADGVITIPIARSGTEFGELVADGAVTLPLNSRALRIDVGHFRLQRDAHALALQDPVAIEFVGGRTRIEGLRLSGSAGSLALDLNPPPTAGEPTPPPLRARARALRLSPFLSEFLGDGLELGQIDGTASLLDAPTRLDVDLTMQGADLTATGELVKARLVGTWAEGVATIKEGRAQLPGQVSVFLTGSAPLGGDDGRLLVEGPVALQGSVELDSDALRSRIAGLWLGEPRPEWLERLSGSSSMTIDVAGQWTALRGRVALELDHVELPRPARQGTAIERGAWLPDALSGTLEIALEDGGIQVLPSTLTLGDEATIEASGSIEHGLDVAALVERPEAARRSWLEAVTHVRAVLGCDDLSWVASFAPELRETGGVLRIEGSADGSLGDLKPSGRLTLTDGTTRYRGAPPVEKAHLEILLEPDQVSIERADLELGASPVSVTGNMLLGQGSPRLDFAIRGKEVLLTRTRSARLRANLDLTVQGRTDAPRVMGSVALVGGRLKSPVEFQRLLSGSTRSPEAIRRGFQLPSFGPKNVQLDLRVTTADPIRLEGRIARGAIRGDLEIGGDAEQPVPKGRVFFDPLEVAVPAGTIVFPTGLVRFDPDSPDIPRLDLVGTTRLAGYDITVNIDGDYDEPDIDLSSSPPLAPEDLLLLVLSGQPPSAGGGLEAAGQSVALYVAKDLVRGWFSSGGFEDGDRESFLDRLQVVTGRDVSRSGVLTVEATYKLKQGFAREKDALYVVVERDSFEDYGIGLRLVLRIR